MDVAAGLGGPEFFLVQGLQALHSQQRVRSQPQATQEFEQAWMQNEVWGPYTDAVEARDCASFPN